jgi:hypothetical protein
MSAFGGEADIAFHERYASLKADMAEGIGGNEAYGVPADSETVLNVGSLVATTIDKISAVVTVGLGELSTVARMLSPLTA